MNHTKEGYPIWDADYTPGPDTIEGEIVQDLLPYTKEGTPILLTAEQIGQLLLKASALAFTAAEQKRLQHATTPDGRHDKTIHGYKPVPYHQALQESSPIQDVPHAGEEIWLGDSINPIPSACAATLFLNYPSPLLLAERCKERTEE